VNANRSGIAAIAAASVLWGTTGTAASFLPDSVGPLAIGASTMAVGGILLFLASARSALGVVRDAAARRWLVLGAAGVVVYPLAFYSSMSIAGVAIGNVVSLGSGPVFAAIIEWVAERRRLSGRWLLSTGFAVVGLTLLSVAGVHTEGEAASVGFGVLLGLLAGLAYALYTYCSSRIIELGHPARAVMGGVFGAGALPLLVVLVIAGAPLVQSAHSAGIAAYLAVGPMFVAYLLFGAGLRTVRSSTATTVTLLEPLVATLLAVLVVGEVLTLVGWIGVAVIALGVCLLVTARPTGPASASP
jgi:DME family drug/metabolite transporter